MRNQHSRGLYEAGTSVLGGYASRVLGGYASRVLGGFASRVLGGTPLRCPVAAPLGCRAFSSTVSSLGGLPLFLEHQVGGRILRGAGEIHESLILRGFEIPAVLSVDQTGHRFHERPTRELQKLRKLTGREAAETFSNVPRR